MNKHILMLAVLCAAGIAQASDKNTKLEFTEDNLVGMPPLVETFQPTVVPAPEAQRAQSLAEVAAFNFKQPSCQMNSTQSQKKSDSLGQRYTLRQLMNPETMPILTCQNQSQAEREMRVLLIALKCNMRPQITFDSSPEKTIHLGVVYEDGHRVVIPNNLLSEAARDAFHQQSRTMLQQEPPYPFNRLEGAS